MAVYGPVRHQKNIIWTEAWVIWQYMDRSIYCHMTLNAMKYLLYIVNQVLKGSKLRIC